jgi:hypothetical protein
MVDQPCENRLPPASYAFRCRMWTGHEAPNVGSLSHRQPPGDAGSGSEVFALGASDISPSCPFKVVEGLVPRDVQGDP